MGLQFTVEQLEKAAFEARIESSAKLIALAIKTHINWKTRKACVSIPRLAYMCNCDQRTVRKHLPDIQRVLGIVIEPQEGKAHTFKLQVYDTAQEINASFEQKEWRKSQWLVFKKNELEELVGQLQAALNGDINGHTTELPLAPSVPPTLDVPPTLRAADPPHSVQRPPSSSVRRTYNNSYKNTCGTCTTNGTKQVSAPRAPIPQKRADAGFDRLVASYQAAMRGQQGNGKGNAHERAETMPLVNARTLYSKLAPEEATRAEAYIPAFAAKAGSFMPNLLRYLEEKPWSKQHLQGHQESKRQLQLRFLVHYLKTGDWADEARDQWGTPCDVPPDLMTEASNLAGTTRELATGNVVRLHG